MSNNSNFKDEFMDDLLWANLFKEAENYDQQEDTFIYEEINDISFYESNYFNAPKYKTPEEALKVLFGYDSFRPG